MGKWMLAGIGCGATLFAAAAAAQTGERLPPGAPPLVLHQHRLGPPAFVARPMLEEADANRDGVVTRAEFNTHRAQQFERIDANRDGVLSREEAHDRRLAIFLVGRPLNDANSDGVISREEFLAAPAAAFAQLDANHDNVLSGAEIPRPPDGPPPPPISAGGPPPPGAPPPPHHREGALSPGARAPTTRAQFNSQSAEMFERLDANRDGRLTREEMDSARRPRRGR